VLFSLKYTLGMERHRRHDLFPARNRTFYKVAIGANYLLAAGILAFVVSNADRISSLTTQPTPTPTAEVPTPTPTRGTIIFNTR